MSDIFTKNDIYPHEGKIKDHFKGLYESVFIAFLPFFKIDGKQAVQTLQKLTFEEAKQKIDVLKNISTINANIYTHSLDNFPSSKEIIEKGKVVSWEEISRDSGLADNSELNKALRTSIGALRRTFQRPDLEEKLNNYTTSQSIWHPIEGRFDLLSKVAIYKTFRLFNKNKIIAMNSYYETPGKVFELDQLTDNEFAEKIGGQDYYLYAMDKELLFAVEWDSFFFLIATSTEKMKKITSENLFEGFLCNEKTEHDWEYKEGEIQKYLDIEAKQKKEWWKFWR